MARIRTIKPDFFRSRTIDKLTAEQRLTFIGLWTHCDDEGRFEFDPVLIKADIWPRSRSLEDIVSDLRALTEASLLTHYRLSERSYMSVCGWREHQRINRPTPSKLPKPEDGEIVPVTWDDRELSEPSVSPHGALSEPSVSPHVSLTEGSLQERKGREGNKDSLNAARRARDDPAFDAFWEAYPRRVGKEPARAAWAKAVRSTSIEDIMAGTKRYATQREGADPQYTAHPATWLNAGRWDDEPPAPTPAEADDFQLPAPPRDIADDPDPAVYVRWARAQRDAWITARTGRPA